jgi:hypothetical protein
MEQQKKYKIEYYRELRYKKKDLFTGKSKWIKEIKIIETVLLAIRDFELRHKQIKQMPHAIAKTKGVELWKFFMSMIDGKMQFLEEPRYMIRIGHHWFKIKSLELI